MIRLATHLGLLVLLTTSYSCTQSPVTPDPIICVTAPTPKLVSRDSLTTGTYRGIAIGASTDEAFTVLDQYRKQGLVTYYGPIYTYFSDVTDLKSRLPKFEWLVLDRAYDTDDGVQLQFESGRLKGITLNNRRSLSQWPELAASHQALQLGDELEILYAKLVALSQQASFATHFARMVLLDRYTYALYDPQKAAYPWRFAYRVEPKMLEEVELHLMGKKVAYITVNHLQE